jgi:hypothetical protein
MKNTKKIILAFGALAVAGVSYAQTTTAGIAENSNGLGLLGTRHTEFSIGLQDITHLNDHGYSVGAAVNDPIIPGVLDAGAAYSYSWIRGAFRGHANTIGAYATAYVPFRGVKPFVSTGLGYQWTTMRFGANDERALWGTSAGVEIPVGRVTITPRANYADDFEGSRKSSQAWTLEVEANYWYSKTSAVFGSIGKTDVRRSGFDSWNYEVGLRARF